MRRGRYVTNRMPSEGSKCGSCPREAQPLCSTYGAPRSGASYVEHKGWHSRGYLPHFDSQDVIQFVTFRLADSLLAAAVAKLRTAAQRESLRDEMLDLGWGACWLERDNIARLVEDAFLAFHGSRYRMLAWTIMPNHIHALFASIPGEPLGTLVSSWKRFTARETNLRLGRSGDLWPRG